MGAFLHPQLLADVVERAAAVRRYRHRADVVEPPHPRGDFKTERDLAARPRCRDVPERADAALRRLPLLPHLEWRSDGTQPGPQRERILHRDAGALTLRMLSSAFFS